MNSLSQDLRSVLARHIEAADDRQILAIASTLAASNDAPSPSAPPAVAGSRFTVDGDMVHDASTGLTWSRTTLPGGRMEWATADAACKALKVGGHTDWRLPTIHELLALVDYDRHNPAIVTNAFQCESNWYWSATPYASAPAGFAWVVYFSGGAADCGGRGGSGFVRPVRGGTQS